MKPLMSNWTKLSAEKRDSYDYDNRCFQNKLKLPRKPATNNKTSPIMELLMDRMMELINKEMLPIPDICAELTFPGRRMNSVAMSCSEVSLIHLNIPWCFFTFLNYTSSYIFSRSDKISTCKVLDGVLNKNQVI
jgi:hypothetical protein